MNLHPPITQSTSQLIYYLLHLADNSLIQGHQNSKWCGHGPVLEQDIAITNISLDLIGQARNFYQYAALLKADGATEDSLAYLRGAEEFKNCLLVEQQNGDWAQTILRQFLFSNYQFFLFGELKNSKDEQLAAIANKSLKEVTYHLRWSSEWVIRLGDGTDESHVRMLQAIENLWCYTGELFVPAAYEENNSLAIDLNSIRKEWEMKVKEVFLEATLPIPNDIKMMSGGKSGNHSKELDLTLADMQVLQRTYPGAEW